MPYADRTAVHKEVDRPEGGVIQSGLQRLEVHAAQAIQPQPAGKATSVGDRPRQTGGWICARLARAVVWGRA